MKQHLKFLTFFFLVTLVAGLGLAGAQDKQAAKAPELVSLSQKLPFDPQVTLGKFDNGLRYYLRVNKKPENRAELQLIVNAGSVLEDDDQQGLAHFVEHMAFNGTKHFAKQELVKFMESIGMRFGPSLNAFTSFDETVYMLTIPTDKPDVIKTAFQILEDWAHELTFDPVEIDKERGVIIEEWRLGRGAYARMRDKQFPTLLKGSRYANRLPIGEKSIIESFKYDTLKRFYRDWYRPDLMAVIAVGDFDRAIIEKLIKEHFAGLPPSRIPRLRPVYDVPDHPETLYAIATDKEATNSSVAVYNKLPVRDQSTLGAYRQSIVEALYSGMLNRRFSELTQKPDAPFLNAYSGRGLFVRSKEAYMLNAMVKEDGIERGLDALFTESERVSRFGFTPTELERQKRDTLRSMERMYAEREKSESRAFASEYMRHFLQGEPSPGIEMEFELSKRFLPEITLEETNKLGREWVSERNRVVMVSAPEKPGLQIPEGPKLAAAMKAVAGKDIKPYVDTASDQPLLEKVPEPGKVIGTKTREDVGITEWELSNGVKVVLKPTNFKQDEIVFRAMSPGGTSLASDKDFVPASAAGQVIAAGGLGKFNAIELRKVLSGKVASVRPYMSDIEEGLMGSASPKDLETLFQLIYLTFTEPRADATIFGVLTTQMKAILANMKASPDYAFMETLQTTLSQNHYRARPITPEIIDEWNLDKSFTFYKDRFADAGDFTFLFVGNIDLEAMKPLVERYLGALPCLHRKETWRDVGIEPPKGVVQKTIQKGIEPKSQTAIVFTGPFQYDRPHRTAIRAMSLVLDTRLRNLLREELSGTYGVQVNASYNKNPREEYTFTINFGCNPGRANELIKALFKEIESLKATGPSEKEADDARQALFREYETGLKQNNWLLTQLYYKYQLGEDPKTIFDFEELLKLINPAFLQDAARTYLNTNNYVQVSLFPEQEKKDCLAWLFLVRLQWPAFGVSEGVCRSEE
jgi:zinc protease